MGNHQNRKEKRLKQKKKNYFGETMNEIVSRLVLKLVIIATILLILIFTIFKSYNVISYEMNTIDGTLSEAKSGIQVHETIQEETQDLFISDYVNRVNNINAILKLNEDQELTSKGLKEIAEFENVSNIYIVNNSGVITQSSDENSIGIDFYKDPELDTFIPLIESKENGYYCELSRNSVITGKYMVYLMVRNESDKLIQIEIEPSALQEYIDGSGISAYIEGIPTKWQRTILVMDNHTGEILAITKNNEQTITGNNLLEELKKAKNTPRIVMINGKWKLTMSKQVSDNLLLVEFSSVSIMVGTVLVEIVIFALLILGLNIFVYYTLIRVLKKHVLQDIINMNEDVKLFASGKDVEIRDARTKELSELSKQLRRLKQGINDSKGQIQLTLSILGDRFTGYEYYADYNRLLYADNCLELTGWTESELEEEVKLFFEQHRSDSKEKQYITTLVSIGDNKIFKLNRYVTNDSVYAIAEDITDEEKLKKKLLSSQEEVYLDTLTKLYNRRKLEHVLQEMNKTMTDPRGVMLLLDLDNFKKVNDEKGHLEGDVLLKRFADLLRENFRDSDLKVRLGGDEFIIFMSNYVPENILTQKIKQFIENARTAFHQYYEEFHLSVSVGCTYMNAECKEFEDLYYYADVAMYTAKKLGKNGYYINKEYIISTVTDSH